MAEKQEPEHWQQEPEEYFSDVFWTHLNPWSYVITFGLRATREEEQMKPTVRVRMPLQQAKALAVMVLGGIRQYEEKYGVDIDLPREVLDSLKIAPEDFERFRGT